MLDIGFSEILVIFVLALIVLGPEKLPRVAAQVGRWIGRAPRVKMPVYACEGGVRWG